MSNVQGGGVLVKNPVSAPGPPPLSKILDPRLSSPYLTCIWELSNALGTLSCRFLLIASFCFVYEKYRPSRPTGGVHVGGG